MQIYRVTFPLVTCDGARDFHTLGDANLFAAARRDGGRFQTTHSWRQVSVASAEVADPDFGSMDINDVREFLDELYTAFQRAETGAEHAELCRLSAMAQNRLDNYEPPDPPGWEGGFAQNH